jgi:hypothetical protein
MRSALAGIGVAMLSAMPCLARAEDAPSPAAPPTPAAAAAAPAASAEDVDAPALDIAPSLRLYGFADFAYLYRAGSEANSWSQSNTTLRGFALGHLNLFLDGQLGPRARSLAEIRFSYFPNGAQQFTGFNGQGQLTGVFQDTYVNSNDYATLGSSATWGGIVIERAWVEYSFSDAFTLRAGQFLTPYGIWNVDHGSPVLIGIQQPNIVGYELFPAHQVGLEAYGSRYFGSARAGYHLTLSNGRIQDNPQYFNYNGRPGFGGRLFLEGSWLGELKMGVSGYAGRYTGLQRSLTVDPPTYSAPAEHDTITLQYDEYALGFDVKWEVRHFVFVAEALWQRINYTPGHADLGGFAPDHSRYGTYFILGYRLPYEILPFVDFQFFNPDSSEPGLDWIIVSPGVQYAMQPNLILKLQYGTSTIVNAEKSAKFQFGKDHLDLFGAQVVWAF